MRQETLPEGGQASPYLSRLGESGEKCQDIVCDKNLCLRVDKPVHTSAGWGKWREMSG